MKFIKQASYIDFLILCILGTPERGTLANSKDPDNAALFAENKATFSNKNTS